MTRRRRERGAGTVLVVALTGVLLLVGLAVAGASGLVVAHRRAHAAADLAALAAAVAVARADPGACASAARVATANAARLVRCVTAPDRSVRVEVVVDVELDLPVGGALRAALPGQARAGPG